MPHPTQAIDRELLHIIAASAIYDSAASFLATSFLQESWNKVSDWKSVLAKLELHGLAPLALQQIEQHRLDIPKQVSLTLNALRLRHKAIAAARYKALSDIDNAFAAAQLPYIALKGLALAQLIYPASASRPMRDIDILVPKKRLNQAADILRELSYKLPENQPSRFMQGVHQLPDASKQVDGFNISVEIHHNTMPRDVFDSLEYEDAQHSIQLTAWQQIPLLALGHTLMLHHLCRHLQSHQPNDTIKLINVVDIVRYISVFRGEIDWPMLYTQYPHVINTLRCLHCIVPLPEKWRHQVTDLTNTKPDGVGECMPALSRIFAKQSSFKSRLSECKTLLMPSRWWMHLYYGVKPQKSLLFTSLIRHPVTVIRMLFIRIAFQNNSD